MIARSIFAHRLEDSLEDRLENSLDSARSPFRETLAPLFAVLIPLVSLIGLVFLYKAALSKGPYIDDNDLLFRNTFIRTAQNPLRYWYRGQWDTKAWPLTHTVYWLSYRLFGENYSSYRIFNLLLHWTIGCRLFTIFYRRSQPTLALFTASLFWFHPIAVECSSWISQSGTLLFTLFLSFWIPTLGESSALVRGFAYCGMLASKGFAFLLPLWFLRKTWAEKCFRRRFLELCLTALVTAYAAILLFVGIWTHEGRDTPSISFRQSLPMNSPALVAEHEPAKIAPAPTLFETSSRPLSVADRVSLMGQSGAYHCLRLLAYLNWPVGSDRPAASQSFSWLYFSFGLSLFALLGWLLFRGDQYFSGALLLFLPASGLFPATFLQYSLVGDRFVYPALYSLALGLGLQLELLPSQRLQRALLLWPFALGVITYFVARLPRAEFLPSFPVRGL